MSSFLFGPKIGSKKYARSALTVILLFTSSKEPHAKGNRNSVWKRVLIILLLLWLLFPYAMGILQDMTFGNEFQNRQCFYSMCLSMYKAISQRD